MKLNHFSHRTKLTMIVFMAIITTSFAQTIVANGDFTNFYNDFTTDYLFDLDVYLSQPGYYMLGSLPSDYDPNFCYMKDHTSSSGGMFIANGATDASKIVWQGSLTQDLEIGVSYDFSIWVANNSAANPASLILKAGTIAMGPYSASGLCAWTRLYGTFTADANRPVLTITNCQTAANGNDFAIDDINIFFAGTTTIPPVPQGEIAVMHLDDVPVPDGSSDNISERFMVFPNSLFYKISADASRPTVYVTSYGVSNAVNCSDFQCASGLPMAIPGGSSQNFELWFGPKNSGPFSFDLSLTNSDADENPYNISVSGYFAGPEIDVQRPAGNSLARGSTYSVGLAAVGCNNSLRYTIDNSTGTRPLEVRKLNTSNFTNCQFDSILTPLPLTIPAGSSASFDFTFCVEDSGQFSMTIEFESNDFDEGSFALDIAGEGFFSQTDLCGQFDSDRNVGLAPVVTNFFPLQVVPDNAWNFGDKTKEYPHHVYWDAVTPYDSDPYDVMYNDFTFLRFIQVYQPSPSSLMPLKLVSASPADKHENWSNAIDGDIYWLNGTTSVMAGATGKPWAIFEFTDQSVRKIDKIRFLNDTGFRLKNEQNTFISNIENQVRKFSVYVSTSSTVDADFFLLVQGDKTVVDTPCDLGDDWQSYPTPLTDAKYVKLVIEKPDSYYRQFGELEVYALTTLADVKQSTITATGAPKADGVDKAAITLTLVDADGNPLRGKTSLDIELYAVPKYGQGLSTVIFDPIVETTTPGVYGSAVASKQNIMHLIRASVNGVVIDKITAGGSKVCEVVFGQENNTTGTETGKTGNALVFVTGTPTAHGEGWTNAVDGDLDGWDGTTTARGLFDPKDDAWGIFKFADGNTYNFNSVSLQVDNGTDDDGRWTNRQTSVFQVYVSKTGTSSADFISVGKFSVRYADMRYYTLANTVSAKYMKLVLLQPNAKGWRQVVEFGVSMNHKNAMAAAAEAEIATVTAPTSFTLDQNYPNPFNPVTTIKYQLPEDAQVVLKVLDINGREVATLINGQQAAGYQSVQFYAASLPSGLYFYTIKAGSFQDTKRMMLVK